MDEVFLTEALGFTIDEHGALLSGEHVHRPATVAEMAMWELLRTPQAQWHDFDTSSIFHSGTLS